MVETTGMDKTNNLKKAVNFTIEAGYQLKEEAFKFLDRKSTSEDPQKLVAGAIQKIETSEDKPSFIDRNMLEDFLIKTNNGVTTQYREVLSNKKKQSEITEGKKRFNPYAKKIESKIKIIDNPGSELTSSGNIEDYLKYFQDRFRRIEGLLRKRIDVKNISSIEDAINARANTKFNVIGMLSRKSEANKNIFLTIEDMKSSATVLIPKNAPKELCEKTNSLLIDQVICLSVVKSRSDLLIAKECIIPDIPHKSQNKASVPVNAVLTSDIHIGSIEFKEKAFNRFILWLNGKYGNRKMRELAGNVKYVLIAGDIVDGVGVYPNQIKELTVKEIYQQYELAAEFIKKIPEYIEVVFIPGNHDAPRKALPQPPISKTLLEPLEETRKIYSLGNPSVLSLHGVEVLIHHGRSLEDVISTIPGIDHEHPEKAMTLLLQNRHIAPIYGGKTPLSPEKRDSLVIDRVPDIYHSGHIHKLSYNTYRGVSVINSGCWQGQTEYMRRHGFFPTPGKIPVVNLQTSEVATLSFM